MNDPSFLEEPLLANIDNQLAAAVANLPNVSHEDLDSITRQKLILDATSGFDVADLVTTQCYLHGEIAVKGKESNRVGNSTLGTAGVESSRIPTEEQVYEYFTEQRREYVTTALEQDTLEWLERYYANEEICFQDVYLAKLPVYRALSRLRESSIERNSDTLPDDLAQTIREHTSNLKQQLLRYPLFRDTPPYVTEFEKAATPVVEWIDDGEWQKETSEISQLYDLFDSLYKFFYRGTWQACAQLISYHTVSGPSEQETRERRKRELKRQNATFRERLYRLQREADSVGLSVSCDTNRLPELKPAEMDNADILDSSAVEPISDDDPVFELID